MLVQDALYVILYSHTDLQKASSPYTAWLAAVIQPDLSASNEYKTEASPTLSILA